MSLSMPLIDDSAPDGSLWQQAVESGMRLHPEKVHLRVDVNLTACTQGGDRTQVQVWGHFLTDERGKVGCADCLSWIHA